MNRSNIFTNMNIKVINAENRIADYYKVLGSSFRIRLLLSIGLGEACVCHLEALLKKRQAYISQHLRVLRDAGILDTRREGKFIYYRVSNRRIFDLIQAATEILDIPADAIPELGTASKMSNCDCPSCQN